MTPVDHIESIEQSVSEGWERKVSELRSELKKAQAEAEQRKAEVEALKSQNAVVLHDAKEQLIRADRYVAQAAGGDWKQLTLVIGGAVSGFALGYYIQKALDIRVPVTALAGGVAFFAGMLMPQRHWSTRLALASGGALMAVGGVTYIFSVEPQGEEAAA